MKLEELYEIIKNRREIKPEGSYVTNLINQGDDRIIQKVGEEAIEVVIAAKNSNNIKLISESADLLFHLLILLEKKGITLDEIYEELRIRNLS
ncbi:MAG: phosphoribosyl-ATP diphosphatase [Candidatus Roizmanbacteria bacterium]|nr:phosphoribosyl-ATP diphosphatase [Candidatus Roizmanbacteria bacterium]